MLDDVELAQECFVKSCVGIGNDKPYVREFGEGAYFFEEWEGDFVGDDTHVELR